MAIGRTGVAENTYRSVTVDKYGRVIAATNPTTVAGYGLTDVYTKTQIDQALGLKAPLDSPTFTGDAKAPTPPVGDNDTSIATTAHVKGVLALYGIGQALEPTETDLNKYTTPGNFITPQGGMTNLPQGWSPNTRYSLVVDGYGASRYLVQTLTTGLPQGVSIAQAQRTMSAAGVWSPWHSVWNSNNTPRQTDPLDLTAAALLNPGSFGVGSAIVTTEVDMNNFQIPGNYLTAASGLLNMPPGWNASQRHSMVVDGLGPSGHLVQTLTAGLAGGEPKQAIRTFTSGKTWTDWEEVATGRHLPIRGRVMYRNAGVYQWTVPPGVTKVDVEVRGGGGSGGFGSQDTGSGGGGGGGISKRLCTVTPGAVITVTVGAGGAAVSTVGATGNAGGASSFGSFCSATGGSGGSSGSGAGGGYGAGGDFNASLGSGNPALRNAPGTYALGGSGGGGESIFATNNSTAPSQPGMGGGGRTSTQSQPGADGCVIITY
ncbi:glycine-rich domain-containing protein [Pseudomonas guariconensis]